MSAFAQGILGAISGMGQAVYKNAFEEQKAEMERIREERLSKLRLQEYRARGDIDLENAPKKADIEIAAQKKSEEELRAGKMETARQRGQIDVETAEERRRREGQVDIEQAPEKRKQKVAEEKELGEVRQGFRLAEIKAHGDNSIRVAIASSQEAAKHNWRPDAEGYYLDGNGERVTTRVKIEGRGYETVPVKAPTSKTETAGTNALYKEELDSINRQIENEFDPRKLEKLRREKAELLKRIGMPHLAGDKKAAPKSADEYIKGILGTAY